MPMRNVDKYHIFILDVMLPGMDWFEFAKLIREKTFAGIIFLTAKSTLQDKASWFEAGADDYMTKPFETKELLFRINALSKRLEDIQFVQYDNIFIDVKSYLARKSGELVHLTPNEWWVLTCLIQARGMVVQRTDILEDVWWGEAIFSMSRSLDVTITYLRKKLSPQLIETVVWIWYKMNLEYKV